jgi:hypothetical protein
VLPEKLQKFFTAHSGSSTRFSLVKGERKSRYVAKPEHTDQSGDRATYGMAKLITDAKSASLISAFSQ